MLLEVSFKSKISINPLVPIDDIIYFIKEKIIDESYKAADKFEVSNSELIFRINYWKIGRINPMAGIKNGKFYVHSSGGNTKLIYSYRIGGHFIFLAICAVLFAIPAFITSHKSVGETLLYILLIYFGLSFLLYLFTLIKQYFFFKSVARGIENKMGSEDRPTI